MCYLLVMKSRINKAALLMLTLLGLTFVGAGRAAGAAAVASIVPSPNVSRPVNYNIYEGMNSLLALYEYSVCVGEPHFFVSPTPSSVVSYLDSLAANGYNYEPLFQTGDNPINTVTLARITGDGIDVYSMFAVTDGSSLMLCDAS